MGRRVLVVDDEESIVGLLTTILGVYGYTPVASRSARDALELLGRESFDAVLLDIAMADMDGYQVCRRIKGDPRWRNLPVVMISALSLEQDRKQALAAGADGFILKPFDPRDLALELGRLLDPAS